MINRSGHKTIVLVGKHTIVLGYMIHRHFANIQLNIIELICGRPLGLRLSTVVCRRAISVLESNDEKRSPRQSSSEKPVQKAGAWLLGFCWLGVVFASMVIAFSPSSYMPVRGWILLPTLRSPEWVLRDGVAVVHP